MKRSLLVWTLCGLWTALDAPAQSLLKDIAPAVDTSLSSGVGGLTATASGLVWFVADDHVHGSELWVTDGTAAGTLMAVDFTTGPVGSPFDALTAVGNRALFAVRGAIWSIDLGSSLPTQVSPTGAIFTSDQIVATESLAFFGLSTATAGDELWVSDGTLANTRLVADLEPGSGSSQPRSLLAKPDGSGIFFVTRLPTTQLWQTDGSTANTQEIAVGTAWTPLAQGATRVLATGPSGIFVASGSDLWVSDGSASPATLVRQGMSPGPDFAVALATHFVFTVRDSAGDREVWSTDGTMAGTSRLVVASEPGTGGTQYDLRIEARAGLAYFVGFDPQHGKEPWVTDGTTAGTRILADVFPGVWSSEPRHFEAVGNQVFFAAYRWDVHEELFVSDGTATGTRLVEDINPGQLAPSSPQSLTAFGSRLFFRAIDDRHGSEPWLSDGTANGTRLLKDIAKRGVGSTATQFVRFGQRFVFTANDGVHGYELWISDGTTGGTSLLADLWFGAGSSYPRDMHEWQGRLWFSAEDPTGRKLWVTDGTAAGTQTWVVPGRGPMTGDFDYFQEIGDRLAFWFLERFAPAELWVTDGSPAGTVHLDFNPGIAGRANPFARMGDHLYFAGVDLQHGLALWRTDGTLAGTTMVADVSPTTTGGRLDNLVAIDDLLWFAGSDIDNYFPLDVEPWISDGTAAGTHRLIDLAPGVASTSPYSFVKFANRVWFASNNVFSNTLYSSDGTAAGTREFAVIQPAAGFTPLVSTPNLLFLGARGSVYVTDGTPSGSISIPIPSNQAAAVEGMVALGSSSRVVFSAQSAFQDREPWTSDGALAGTTRLLDAFPGPLPSTPQEITLAGDHLLFTAATPNGGREPFHARLAEFSAAFAGTFGSACPGSTGAPRIRSGGTPRLGDSTFEVGLTNARPSSAALMLAGPNLAVGGEFGGCAARLLPPAVFVNMGTDLSGAANVPLAIPAIPSLVGVGLYFEWVIADPQGGYLGSLAMSDLLEIVLGT